MAHRAKDGRRREIHGLLAWGLLALAIGLAGSVARAASDLTGTLREAQARLAAGQARDAWALLSPLELEAGGSPHFDYLYGIAALDTGRQAAASMALERVLALEPDFADARMELARARYEAGDYPGAEQQFQYLMNQSPPAGRRAVIDRYLLAMERGPGRNGDSRGRFIPYGEIGVGWDSNANASTGDDTYGGITLDPDNVETDSPFIELAAGFQHGLTTGPGGALLSSGRASYRFNPDADFVDQALVALRTAGRKSWGDTRASVGASGDYGWLNGSQHEWGAGLDLGLGRRLRTNWDLASNGRAGVIRYAQDELEIQDVDRYLGSVALTRSGIGAREGRVGVAALFGTDDGRDAASPYGNDRLGARIFTSWRLAARGSLDLEAAWIDTDFDDSPGFIAEDFSYVDREDEQWTVALGTNHPDWPARGYSLVPTLRYTNTDSTVSLYDYDRFELGVYLRRSRR